MLFVGNILIYMDYSLIVIPANAGIADEIVLAIYSGSVRKGVEGIHIGYGRRIQPSSQVRVWDLCPVVLRLARGACRASRNTASAQRIVDYDSESRQIAAAFSGCRNSLGECLPLSKPKSFPVEKEERSVSSVIDMRNHDRAANIETILVLREWRIGEFSPVTKECIGVEDLVAYKFPGTSVKVVSPGLCRKVDRSAR